ncbi:MAG: hypothetical protein HOK72_06040 [Flavobacteriales bacterium]|nr:hypothetical protein [Flavobacteriales bacterium]
MKKQYSILSVFAALLISFSAMAGNGEYNLGSSVLKMPYFKPNKSIQSIQSITAADKGITEGGFYFHYTPYFPSKKYTYPKEITVGTELYTVPFNQDVLDNSGKWGVGHGIELGSMFRLVDSEPIAIGLKVTWLSLGGAMFKPGDGYPTGYSVSGIAGEVRLVNLGPYFTYGITDQMAVDISYQFSPTYIYSYIEILDDGGGQTNKNDPDIQGFGTLHHLALTYRFDILSVGLGYTMGSFSESDKDAVPNWKIKYGANSFRFLLGIKI